MNKNHKMEDLYKVKINIIFKIQHKRMKSMKA